MTYQQAHLKHFNVFVGNKRKTRSGNKKSKLSKSAFTPAQVYVQFAKENFPDIAETFNQISICCEKCNILYHFIHWY